MSALERNLAGDERIVYRTKPHPVVFVLPLPFILMSLLCFAAGFVISAWYFMLSALVFVFVSFFVYVRSEFVVTNRCVVGRVARGNPEYREVPLIELSSVEFNLGKLSRWFDYGTVVITDRQGGRYEYPGAPTEFYRQIEARAARIQRILR